MNIEELKAQIDALEFAISQIHSNIEQGTLHGGPIANATIRELQLLRVDHMLRLRSAQRQADRDYVNECKRNGAVERDELRRRTEK